MKEAPRAVLLVLIEVAMACLSKNLKVDLLWSEPYLFSPGEVTRVPPGVPGVYVLMAATPLSPTLVPFYVGASADLRRRLSEHLRSRSAVVGVLPRVLSCYVALARVDRPALRREVERALILRERPAGNGRVPTDPPAVHVDGPPISLLD